MNIPREYHVASILSDGRVLVTGGKDSSGTVNTAELYDPSTNNWTMTGSMSQAQYAHTTTVLSHEKVLITGGSSLKSAEL